MDLQSQIISSGHTTTSLSESLEISDRTIKKWIATNRPPKAVFLYLRLKAQNLGGLDKNWTGWTIADGVLWTPEGTGYSPGDVQSIWYLRQIAKRKTIKYYEKNVLNLANHLPR